MTTQALKEKLKNGEDILLIDVREENEFKNGAKIPGSENIPMEITASEISERNIAKDRKIILICRTGNRSGFVTQRLKELGYNAENLEGGVIAWTN
ncbi:MAG TPA: rhodanese-like domain-containing protein [Candidatus Paceibacterota bacterium]|nr:rhodanese-like domain-containing protein [Candidatus Paceibacterota bacterium]